MIPTLALVHVEEPGGRSLHLWLPLFLLWIVLLILSPLLLLVVLVYCLVGQVSPWRAIVTLGSVVWSLGGTDVRVTAEGRRVTVRIL